MLTLLAVLGRVPYRRSLLLPTLLVAAVLVGWGSLAPLLGSSAPQVGSAPAAAPPLVTNTPAATATCSPGWTFYPNPAPPGESILSGTVALAANDLWAVGTLANQTLTVHGDGTSWTYVPSPNPSGTAVLYGVAGVASNDAWAVGAYFNGTYWQTLTEHWNGTAWTIVPSPNSLNNNYLYAVTAIASNDVWAVGMSQSTGHLASVTGLTEHWNGTNWSIVAIPSGTGTPLYGVAAVSASDVWAVGGGYPAQPAYGRAYIAHWNGSAWSTVANPANNGSSLHAVAVVAGAANDVWAVGYTGGSGTGQTLIEHWDGSAWTVVPSPNPGATTNLLYGVSGRASNDVWAVGDTNQASGGVKTFALHWDGSGWFQVPTPDSLTGRDYFYGVATPDGTGGAVWAVGTTGCTSGCTQNALIARLVPSCLTPVPTTTPAATITPTPACGLNGRGVSSPNLPGGGRLLGAAPVAANGIWAVGVYYPNSHIQALTEHWDGTQWSIVPYDPNPGSTSSLYAVAAVASDDVWAVGSGGGTITMHWNGSYWTRVPSPSPGDLQLLTGVAAVAATDVWAVGGQQTNSVATTLIEHWDGSTWSVVSSPNVGSSSFLNAAAAVAGNANDIWAVGYSDGLQTLVEHWNGTSWNIVPSPGLGSLQSVSAVAANDIWAVGCSTYSCNSVGAQTLIEHWNGTTWSIVPSPNPGAGNNELYGVAALAPGDVWAVGTYYASGGPSHPLIEHWNGSSWSAGPSAAGVSLFGVEAVAANNVWAVGDLGNYNGGFLMRYNDPCPGTGTPTATATVINSLTNTPASTPANTRTPTRTATNTPNSTATPAATNTPANTPTSAPSNTPAYTPVPTQTPRGPSATPVPSNTPPTSTLPPSATPPPPSVTARPSATPCTSSFTDVHPTDYFYTPVQYLACHGVISGYADGTFRPYATTTRSQMVKIVVLGFNKAIVTPSGGNYTFTDVPPAHPFFAVIETAAADNIVSGYACGGPGEPCDSQHRPYLRPYASVTRGQLSKIDVVAATWLLQNPAMGTFIDVLPGSAFYQFVETAACHGVVSGYACGGPGEPCDAQRRPYFRQYANATRGQIAKIVYLSITGAANCTGPGD